MLKIIFMWIVFFAITMFATTMVFVIPYAINGGYFENPNMVGAVIIVFSIIVASIQTKETFSNSDEQN